MSQTELERGVSEVLIDEDRLRSRVVELGEEISADYAGRDLLLIGVLKGAVFFMADLMRTLAIPCEIDFMAISSYGAQTDSSGVVRILKEDINIEGRNVLVVEDIIVGTDPVVSDPEPGGSRARHAGGLCASDEAGPARDRRARPLHRLRDPQPLRRRLWARFRRAIQEPALRGRIGLGVGAGGRLK